MPAVSQLILTATHQMWKERCNHRHRRDHNHQSLAEKAQLARELEALYNLEQKVLPCGKHALLIPLSEHKERSPWKIKRWALRWSDALKQSAKAAEEKEAPGPRRIYSYFLDASKLRFAQQPKVKCRKKPRAKPRSRMRVAPTTARLNSAGIKRSASQAAPATRRLVARPQALLAGCFPRGLFPGHPS